MTGDLNQKENKNLTKSLVHLLAVHILKKLQ
uniref:Uncharacterized protein n=1 Tax=Rhizophora mucronata TaxID=61149 RepID=A0A2P2QSM0_RHIMU